MREEAVRASPEPKPGAESQLPAIWHYVLQKQRTQGWSRRTTNSCSGWCSCSMITLGLGAASGILGWCDPVSECSTLERCVLSQSGDICHLYEAWSPEVTEDGSQAVKYDASSNNSRVPQNCW